MSSGFTRRQIIAGGIASAALCQLGVSSALAAPDPEVREYSPLVQMILSLMEDDAPLSEQLMALRVRTAEEIIEGVRKPGADGFAILKQRLPSVDWTPSEHLRECGVL